MNLKQAEYLLKVAETGSISKAAAELYVSQPSLSQMLKNLEECYGTELFQKKHKPAELTEAGKIAAAAARQLLNTEKLLREELQELSAGAAGDLRIGIAPNMAKLLLPKLLPDFMRRFPKVKICLTERSARLLEEQLLNEQLDFAYITPTRTYAELSYQLLGEERLVLISAEENALVRRFPNESRITLRDAAEEQFISLKKGHKVREQQDRIFCRYGNTPQILLETDDVETAAELALRCQAVALIPERLLTPALRNVPHFFIENTEDKLYYALCWRNDRKLPQYMQAFQKINS